MFKKITIATTVAAVLSSAPAIADININGFATITGGKTLGSTDKYSNYDNSLSYNQNSLFGLQVNAEISDKMTATAQIVTRGSDDWNAQMEWAYVTYQLTDDIKVNFGRQRVPYFIYSDFIDVGYAYHWATPPEEVYNLVTDSYEGISVLVQNTIGAWDSTLQLISGANSGTFSTTEVELGDGKQEGLFGAAWSMNKDWFTGRVSYFASKVTLNSDILDPLASTWQQVGFESVGKSVSLKDELVPYFGLGVSIDKNDYFAISEYTVVKYGESVFAEKDTSFYLTVGKRVNDLTFHLTAGEKKQDSNYSEINALPAGASPALDQLIGTTRTVINAFRSHTRFYQAGVKYDFTTNASFKAEVAQYQDQITDTEVELVRFSVTTIF